MEKSEIRRKVKNLRSMLLAAERERAADEVFARLEETAAFVLSDHIMMYHSLEDELSTLKFLSKWKDRKHFYLPRVNGVNLEVLPYEETRLELGAFHIEEPTGANTIDPNELELIIVPGVAYDRKGNRLGRGKGFYDRLLSDINATKIGVGYEFQLFDEIPAESHDVKMDAVITQNQCIIIRDVSPKRKRGYRN